jgi:hypothetical protein
MASNTGTTNGALPININFIKRPPKNYIIITCKKKRTSGVVFGRKDKFTDYCSASYKKLVENSLFEGLHCQKKACVKL